MRRWFEVHHPATFMLHSIKVDKFGRILGDIRAKGKKFSLCAFLLSSGMAKVYEGKRRQWEQDELDSIYVTAEEWLAKTNDEWLRLESASAPFPS